MEGNNAPDTFNLLIPEDDDVVATALPLMWEASTDPDGDNLSYTVEISEDTNFTSFALKEEGITDEFIFIGTEAGLDDLTTYYWRVIAIDQHGAQTICSDGYRSFNTDNTNGIPGYLMGLVIDPLGNGIGGVTVETSLESTSTFSNGSYQMSHPSGTFTVTVTAAGYQTESLPGVEILPTSYTNRDFVMYSENDSDKDGYADDVDNCPVIYNPYQADSDEDGTGDECDGCPDDPYKTEQGLCGCGIADIDSDEDGTLDCNDNCPYDPNKITPGQCGCGFDDIDSDGDGTADCIDNDYDNDGMPDDWEDENGLDPLIDDADEDLDGDGFKNILEYLRNTDPQDPTDHPSRAMPWVPLLLGDD